MNLHLAFTVNPQPLSTSPSQEELRPEQKNSDLQASLQGAASTPPLAGLIIGQTIDSRKKFKIPMRRCKTQAHAMGSSRCLLLLQSKLKQDITHFEFFDALMQPYLRHMGISSLNFFFATTLIKLACVGHQCFYATSN